MRRKFTLAYTTILVILHSNNGRKIVYGLQYTMRVFQRKKNGYVKFASHCGTIRSS